MLHLLRQTLKSLKVRVSVIGLSAEVRVCTVLTRETGGSYHVILDESHFKELLMLHIKPPPASSSSECSLIRMGEYADAVSISWYSVSSSPVTYLQLQQKPLELVGFPCGSKLLIKTMELNQWHWWTPSNHWKCHVHLLIYLSSLCTLRPILRPPVKVMHLSNCPGYSVGTCCQQV